MIVAASAEPGAFRAAGEAMYRYFTGLVAAKRANPADDLVSALIDARDSADSLTSASSSRCCSCCSWPATRPQRT